MLVISFMVRTLKLNLEVSIRHLFTIRFKIGQQREVVGCTFTFTFWDWTSCTGCPHLQQDVFLLGLDEIQLIAQCIEYIEFLMRSLQLNLMLVLH